MSDALLGASADDVNAAIAMANTWSHAAGNRLTNPGTPGVWNLGAGQRLIERCGPGVYNADFRACNGFDPAALPALPSTLPVLVIAAANDQMTPPSAGAALAQRLPAAELVRIPDCGHAMLSEQPNRVLDALAGFLAAPPERSVDGQADR